MLFLLLQDNEPASPNQKTQSPASSSLSTVPSVNILGTPAVDWPGLIKQYQTPNICYEFYLAADNSDGMPRERRREYVPAAPGETVELLQNKVKTEDKVGRDQCILTYSYRSGNEWVPFQRQLAPADLASAVDVRGAVRDGLDFALEQLGGESLKSKKSGAPSPTEYQLLTLAYQIYTNFKTYKVVKSYETTPQPNDLVSTQTPSWRQVMDGVDASNLGKEDKEFVKNKIREYYSSGISAETSGPAAFSPLSVQLSDIITDYLFLPSNMATLPSSTIGQYLRAQHDKTEKDMNSVMGDLVGYSQGVFSANLYDGLAEPYLGGNLMRRPDQKQYTFDACKAGLTADGKPFVAVGQAVFDMVKANQPSLTFVGFPPYLVPAVPAGGVVLLEGKRENGQWKVTSRLSQQSADYVLDPVFRTDRQHFGILDVWAKAPLSADLVTSAGRYPSIKAALADPKVNSALVVRGLVLLQDGVGKMDSMWQESVPFGAFSTHVPQNHQLLFGRKGDSYYVVDCDLSVRGKGSTPAEAMADLETCGWVAGVYTRDPNKKVGAASWTGTVSVQMAIPAEQGWFREALQYVSNLEWCYMAPWLWTQVAGAVGSLGRFISTKIDASELALHKGSSFNPESAESLSDVSDVMLGIGVVLAFSRLGVLNRLGRLGVEGGSVATKIMFGSEMAAFAGSGGVAYASQRQRERHISSLVSMLSEDHISKLKKPGKDVVTDFMQATMLEDYNWAREQDHQPPLTSAEAAIDLQKNWIPRILSALNIQMPLGPEGATEVVQTKRFMLAPSIEWTHQNREFVKRLASDIGWPVSTTLLYILMFGGPTAAPELANTQITYQDPVTSQINSSVLPSVVFQDLKPGDYRKAASYLQSQAPASWGLDLDKLYADLTLGFMDGRIRHEEIRVWALQGDFKGLIKKLDERKKAYGPAP